MDSADLRYLLWGALFAGLCGLLSLAGGGSRWKRTLRSIGLAFGLGFVVFPLPETGEWGVRHVLALLAAMSDYPYPIGQALAVSLGVAFWCFWLAVAFVLLGLVPERDGAARPAGPPSPDGERREPALEGEREEAA